MNELDLSKIDTTCFYDYEGNRPEECENSQSFAQLAFEVTVILFLVLTSVFIFRKFSVLTKLKNNRRTFFACISAWVVWCFIVFCYTILFKHLLNFYAWFTLPPLIVIFTLSWWHAFVAKKL